MSRSETFGQNYLTSLGILPVVLISPFAFVPFVVIPAGLFCGVFLRIRHMREEFSAMLAALFTWIGVIASVRYLFF